MKQIVTKKPIVFSLVVTVIFLILMLSAFILGSLLSDIPNGENIGQFLGKILVSTVFTLVLWRFHWLKVAGFTKVGDLKNWLIVLILLVYAVLSTAYALTGSIGLSFSNPVQYFWITANMMGSGLAEEIVYRGLVFYCFLVAWDGKRNRTILSGIVSAAIFGYSHLIWVLLGKDPTLGFLQSTAAFASGIFYAGVLVHTRSLWPVVVIHGLTNAFVYIRISEIPDFSETITGGILDIAYSVPLVIYGLFSLWKDKREKTLLTHET
jgi:membrane protease YdiL (CAAX protease family)